MRTRPDREDYAFVIIILGTLSLLWFAYAYQACGVVDTRCILDGLKEWQNLIAGVLATAAAGISVWYIRKQITQQDQRARYERARRIESYKPMLSLALSEVCEMALKDGNSLLAAKRQSEDPPELQWSPLLSQQLEVIRLAIEFEDDSEVIRETLNQLVHDTQIHRARRRAAHETNFKDHVIQCAIIYGRASDLFSYSRKELQYPSRKNTDYIRSYLFAIKIFTAAQEPELTEYLTQRFPNIEWPFNA